MPCVPLCPAFLCRVFVRFACLKTRVLAWCLRRPCRLALSAGRLSASARFCAKQNILCFLRVGLLSGVCCCVLTAKILSFICTNSRPSIFQFSGNRFFLASCGPACAACCGPYWFPNRPRTKSQMAYRTTFSASTMLVEIFHKLGQSSRGGGDYRNRAGFVPVPGPKFDTTMAGRALWGPWRTAL